jgi:hypothetical protein
VPALQWARPHAHYRTVALSVDLSANATDAGARSEVNDLLELHAFFYWRTSQSADVGQFRSLHEPVPRTKLTVMPPKASGANGGTGLVVYCVGVPVCAKTKCRRDRPYQGHKSIQSLSMIQARGVRR